jgi:GST-like protein
VRVFDSSAILLYLGEKTGRLIGSPADRPELLSWLFFIATGIGPFSGQAVHFQHAAPEKVAYAVNRYRREIERHYEVLDKHLKGREFIVGKEYSIADISAWGWLDRAPRVLPGDTNPLRAFPNMERWFRAIDSRPAVAKARAVGKDHAFKKEVDEETRRALFPSNYPKVAS